MTLFYSFYAILGPFCLLLWTNLYLIKSVSMFVVCLCGCSFCKCLILRKRPQRSLQSVPTPHYKQALIVLERTVDLESLEGTFIPDVFKERTWTKLLNPMVDMFEDIIREFFTNVIVEGDHINCWLKGRELSISRKSIQEILEIRPMTPDTSL